MLLSSGYLQGVIGLFNSRYPFEEKQIPDDVNVSLPFARYHSVQTRQTNTTTRKPMTRWDGGGGDNCVPKLSRHINLRKNKNFTTLLGKNTIPLYPCIDDRVRVKLYSKRRRNENFPQRPARKKTRQNRLCYFYDTGYIRAIYTLELLKKPCSVHGRPQEALHTHTSCCCRRRRRPRVYILYIFSVSICMCLLFLSTFGNIIHKVRFTWNSVLRSGVRIEF